MPQSKWTAATVFSKLLVCKDKIMCSCIDKSLVQRLNQLIRWIQDFIQTAMKTV